MLASKTWRYAVVVGLAAMSVCFVQTCLVFWGHDVGDEAIVALTRQLQITLRGSDVIGRFGGDEFAVIMSGTPAESAITAMLRVREGLNTLRLPNTPQVTLRISVGVAPLNPQMSHYREWLKSADLALYKAKKAGRNRTEVAA